MIDPTDIANEQEHLENRAYEAPADDGESIALFEPVVVGESSRHYAALRERAVDLKTQGGRLRGLSFPGISAALPRLMKTTEAYYSNAIEGHVCPPEQIDRDIKLDLDDAAELRSLQLEARAHIRVQQNVARGKYGKDLSERMILGLHHDFCGFQAPAFKLFDDPVTGTAQLMRAGEYRHRRVSVGRHVPPSPGAVRRFMRRFDEVHRGLAEVEALVATATAHHRLLWVHPFIDLNGRVARLMSVAMLRKRTSCGAMWSLSRALFSRRGEYFDGLAACDLPRRNDLDGRGSLSEEALANFARWFLESCIEEVEFMTGLVQREPMLMRIREWADGEVQAQRLPSSAPWLVEVLTMNDGVARRGLESSLGQYDLDQTIAALQVAGLIVEERSEPEWPTLYLHVPIAVGESWLPGLLPSAGSS